MKPIEGSQQITGVDNALYYQSASAADGSYAMVYAPVGRKFAVNMDKITGAKVKAWWFNPRDGKATAIGTFENKGVREFTPPDYGEMMDWVLALVSIVRW